MDPKDVSLFNKFMPSTTSQDHILQPTIARNGDQIGDGRNLAEIILEKIAAHEATNEGQPMIHGGGPAEEAVELPVKVVEVYSKYEDRFSLKNQFKTSLIFLFQDWPVTLAL